jgi:hypothetical protein
LPGLIAAALVVLGPAVGAQGRTFYVADAGQDASAGLSAGSAWSSIARVNEEVLRPGDTVLFEGGSVFHGTVRLANPEGGTPAAPITFGSFGTGPALISAGAGGGFDFYNVAGIRLRDLTIVGSGVTSNNGIGISFYADLPGGVKLPWIRLERTRVLGFRQGGLSLGSYNGTCGFQDVRVEYCRFEKNGNNGMAVWGAYDPFAPEAPESYAHRSIYVGHCLFASNHGDPARTRHTGSGLEIAQAMGVLVERNVARDNGRLNRSSEGGPVGIWLWDVKNGVVQYNESHHNASSTLDGGGFDLDGGSVDCVLQYNYSHDNDGPGFQVAQFPGARPLRGALVRYNVSERDGGRADAPALNLWNGDPASPIEGAVFFNNTVYSAVKALGNARVFRTHGIGPIQGSGFANNVFFAEGVELGEVSSASTPLFAGNLYHVRGAPFAIEQDGVRYGDLATWRAGTFQEQLFGLPTGSTQDPRLFAPGQGGTIDDPDRLASLNAYRLQGSSGVVDLGLVLSAYGIPPGLNDFYGRPLPAGAGYALGAHESR